MSYQVLARKWRPQQFDDVVGQQHVTQTLKNAITSNRIAHAYLFVGPRGIGKTSVARIFAKALNCADGATVTPCDKCDTCREIMAGTSLDVLEIDGASNNGVEQVRELRETVKYAPTRGNYKIYIIDEVHMLSVAAFNALLKTLEEPPPHVKFIFATTEPDRIPATILSRCQRFDLRRIASGQIVERLRLIAGEEGIEVDNAALLAVARGAEGALRDAESALDQLVSFKGTRISEDDVLSVFGLVSQSTLEQLAGRILEGDMKSIIGIIAELDHSGKDLQRLVLELIGHFRNLLVYLHVEDDERQDLMESQKEALRTQGKMTDSTRLLRIADILSETEDRMRYALSRRALVETALIRCARASVVVTLEEVLARINAMRSTGAGSAGGKESVPAPGTAAEARPQTGADGAKKKEAVTPHEPARPAGEPSVGSRENELPLLLDHWADVVEKVGKIAIAVRSTLIDARPLAIEGDRVVIGLDAEFEDEIVSFESVRNRKAVERVLSVVLRRTVNAEFKVCERNLAEERGADEAIAVVDEKLPAKEAESGTAQESDGDAEAGKAVGRNKREWLEDPAVQKTLEVFNGTILKIRE
jgi:DNA polymerase-3 subunit gamma/tau